MNMFLEIVISAAIAIFIVVLIALFFIFIVGDPFIMLLCMGILFLAVVISITYIIWMDLFD